jgi:hypothetical protein
MTSRLQGFESHCEHWASQDPADELKDVAHAEEAL